jgi:CxxC-x17-CxxC domain-containing protein
MHQAVCAECGRECEVPFKPSGDRPVLCSICFKQSRGENVSERRDDRHEERRDFDRPRNEDRKMYDAICAECGQHCQVPFRPKPGRDIFCSDCFGRDEKREHEPKPFTPNQAPKSANYDNQFAALNSKLDKLIGLLSPKTEIAAKPAAIKSVEVMIKKETAKPEIKKADKKIVKKDDKKDLKKKVAKKK